MTSVVTLVGGGPAALASAEEVPIARTDTGVSTPQPGREGEVAGNVFFRAGYGLSLGRPTTVMNSGTWTLDHFLNAADKGVGYRMTFDDPWTAPVPEVKVTWPLLQGDASDEEHDTGYTVSALTAYSYYRGGVEYRDGRYRKDCTVTDRNGQQSDRYQCSLEIRSGTWDYYLHLTDKQVDRLAEASGTISTVGSVSLEEGSFETESSRYVSGAKAVPAGSSTQFDATLSSSDVVEERRLARGTFKYALLDDGKTVLDRESGQPLYVSGKVYNYNGVSFRGGSACQIVAGPAYRPVENSGYSCEIDGYYGGSVLTAGRAQYITDFTIRKNT